MNFQIIDHSDEVLKAFEERARAALDAAGGHVENHAKQNVTKAGRVDTGALRNSISHKVEGDTAYIGTNQAHAIYNELGTGIYAEGGRGRKSPWAYQDDKGNWHRTTGMRPIHFLKRAVEEHKGEIRKIIESIMRGRG